MADQKVRSQMSEPLPMFKTVEQMSRISGIGVNKLRELMDNHEIAYVENGNRRLLADQIIWDWYQRNRVIPTIKKGAE